MAIKTWMTWILFSGFLSSEAANSVCGSNDSGACSNRNATYLVMVKDNSNLIVTHDFTSSFDKCSGLDHIIVLQNHTFQTNEAAKRKWPEIEKKNNSFILTITKWHTRNSLKIHVLIGKNCSAVVNQSTGGCSSDLQSGSCQMKCFNTTTVCNKTNYDETLCKNLYSIINDKYIVNVSSNSCINCNNPVKAPQESICLDKLKDIVDVPNVPSRTNETLDSSAAAKMMDSMQDLASKINKSTVALSLGESISGVLLKQVDPRDMEEVSFGYTFPNDSFSILQDKNTLSGFSRSVTVSKEAFEMAMKMNVSEPFAAVFRFLNLSKDDNNSTVLGDEVIAIEMGAAIKNLTDTININFWNMDYKGIPTCYSWKGDGRPNWTSNGCETVTGKNTGKNITCRCSHMTFFAVLLTPLNETISSNDLNTLTTITRVGCGLSMFFLGIVLFMHFVMRRAISSNSTKILIHLVFAMFLLDFSFLINDFVAKTKNTAGCVIMAALMHYFMLTTFTWFAVHAFHLCLQLYSGGKIVIRRYVLKVSLTSWILPSVVGIVLLSIGKYGKEVIYTDNPENNVAMCWITDNNVHLIVNVGYYALVFLFTFSTFIIMLTWLNYMRKKQKAAGDKGNGLSCQKIVTIMGLCCILGVTWGCAFFAYGAFRVPAYYLFTILNSFQGICIGTIYSSKAGYRRGFCLFIYYYKTSRMVQETKEPNSSSTSGSTLKTNLDEIFNPYDNFPISAKQ